MSLPAYVPLMSDAVRAVIADPDALGPMLDRLAEAQMPNWRRLSYNHALPDLLGWARQCDAECRSAAWWARGLVGCYVGHVVGARLVGEASPETEPSIDGEWYPTERETEGDYRYRTHILRLRRWYWTEALCAEAHVRRLVDRGLRGEDVPPDVGRHLSDLVYEVRACFALRADMRGRRAPWEEGVRA